MSPANRTFYGLVTLAVLVASSLGVATTRLLLSTLGDAGSIFHVISRWCLHLLTGSPEVAEILLLGLLGLLPVASLLGLSSFVRHWWATRRLVRSQATGRLHLLPQRVACLSDRLGLTGRVDVVRAALPYSFCYGLLQPRICLSTSLVHLLTDVELEAVLLHERYHLKSRDPLKVLLARVLGRAFFFLPVVAELGRHYIVVKELAADRAVIGEQGQGRWLASALFKLITIPSVADASTVTTGLIDATDVRIDHLLEPGTTERLRFSTATLATSVSVLVAIAAIVFSPGLAGAGLHVHPLGDGVSASCLL